MAVTKAETGSHCILMLTFIFIEQIVLHEILSYLIMYVIISLLRIYKR